MLYENIQEAVEYINTITDFLSPTVETHRGKLVFGHLAGQAVVVMAGRFHYYEGYSMKEVTFPVRVLKFLGIERLFISNISGSTSPHIFPGDLVFIRDHINLQPENPLRGINDPRLGACGVWIFTSNRRGCSWDVYGARGISG